MDKIFVISSQVNLQGCRPAVKRLPRLALEVSSIPSAGIGVFANERISKNQFITEYGGELLTHLPQFYTDRDLTHIITLSHGIDWIDSRVTMFYPLSNYVDEHNVGGFVNDPFGSGNSANAVYHWHPNGRPFAQIDGAGRRTAGSSKRVFLRALRDIEVGEEILVNYGRAYHRRHFVTE